MSDTPISFATRKKLGWLLAGSAGLIATVLTVWQPPLPAHRPPAATAPTQPASERIDRDTGYTDQKVSRHETTSALPATETTHRPISKPRAVPSAIAQVFPELTELPADWRKFRPDTITVAPHADLPITFTRIALKEEDRYVTWIGRNPHMPGASLVGVATANGYDAILVIPASSQFSFHIRGQTVVTAETSPGEEICGADSTPPPPVPVGTGASVVEVTYAQASPIETVVTTNLNLPAVDVLFAYNAAALAEATAKSSDPVGYIDAQCKATIEMSNIVLGQSSITTFTWNYLGAVATPAYTTGETLSDDLKAIAPGGAIGNWVKTTRYQRGADQLMLLTGNKSGFSGMAYSSKQGAIQADYALGAMVWNGSYRTLAHELAHNFGCQHDRAHANATAADNDGTPDPENNGLWCYGYMWQNPPLPPGYTGNPGTGGTIMSYANWIIPYFSNPNISVRLTGSLLGWSVNPDLGSQQIGQSETQPNAAYNARVLSERAEAMVAISEAVLPPTIIIQPQSTNATPGQSFTLSVTAAGGGLAYQWSKNGVAISGAQNASYSKIADASEPDSYQVTISNILGSVTSNAVRVTVTTQPSPGSGGSSSGGGGGGGGSLSGWFCDALFLLLMARGIFLGKLKPLPL